MADATQYLYDLGKQPTVGKVVAELSYGFWVALFANAYDTTLWLTNLHRLFTPRVKDRNGLYDALDRLRTLRNRIAHHEPIFQRRLADDYRRIRNIVGFISVPTLTWLDHHSTVTSALGVHPPDVRSFTNRHIGLARPNPSVAHDEHAAPLISISHRQQLGALAEQLAKRAERHHSSFGHHVGCLLRGHQTVAVNDVAPHRVCL